MAGGSDFGAVFLSRQVNRPTMRGRMSDFFDSLTGEARALAGAIRNTVLTEDKAVSESAGAYMNAKQALLFKQAGVLKYALNATARGLSFHSMAMYASSDAARFARQRLTGVKLQKGCFTIVAPEAFDLGDFADFIRLSARQDFQPVIDHYARMAKRKKR